MLELGHNSEFGSVAARVTGLLVLLAGMLLAAAL
jgi:hypothetical protein